LTATDWATFRGPNSAGVSDTTNLPEDFGPTTNVVWKTALPAGHSSPSIAGDRIFVTGFEKSDLYTMRWTARPVACCGAGKLRGPAHR
jgi:hypothetical protein